MSKHTPGPWAPGDAVVVDPWPYYGDDGKQSSSARVPATVLRVNEKSVRVRFDEGQDPFSNGTTEERLPHRAIYLPTPVGAVAAEFLTEVDDILAEDAVCDHSVGICWCEYHRKREALRAAIAKAEGSE